MTNTIAVIGAGISGVSFAYEINKLIKTNNLPYKVKILEASSRSGGVINSQPFYNHTIENGPEAFLTQDKYILSLIDELGLSEDLISMNSHFRRTFIYSNNELNPLPDGFRLFLPTNVISFLASPILSFGGKLAVLKDLLYIFKKSNQDESLHDFVVNRFGMEIYKKIAQPMLSAIYGGDPKNLSVNSTIKLLNYYRERYGSVLYGLQMSSYKKKNEAGPRYSLFMTLKNGLEELIKAMLNSLPDDSLMLNAEVTSIKENNGNYLIDFKNKSSMLASSVVLATPAYISANVLAQLDDKVGKALSTIKYSSAIVVNLFYNIADLDDKLQGFGYVVPQSEGKFVQACSFSSVKFPDKLNNEYHLLRAFICGSQAKESLGLSHNEIIDKAVSEINDILKIKKKRGSI